MRPGMLQERYITGNCWKCPAVTASWRHSGMALHRVWGSTGAPCARAPMSSAGHCLLNCSCESDASGGQAPRVPEKDMQSSLSPSVTPISTRWMA